MAESRNSQDGKSRLHEKAIAALMTAPSVEAAAQETGVTGRTLHKWMREPEFLEKWNAAKRALVQTATARLRSGMVASIAALEQIRDDKETPASVKVSASRTILEFALRSHEIEDLQERLTALERNLGR